MSTYLTLSVAVLLGLQHAVLSQLDRRPAHPEKVHPRQTQLAKAEVAQLIRTLVGKLSSEDAYDQRKAIAGFLELGTKGVPALVDVLRKGREKIYMPPATERAARILDRLGGQATAALPALIADFHDSEQHYTVMLARLMGRIGPFAPAYRGAIRRQLRARHARKPRTWLKKECLHTYHRLGIEPNAPLKEIIKGLYSRNFVHKVMAAEILADRGRAASAATPHLERLLLAREATWKIPGEHFGMGFWIVDDEPLRQKLAFALLRVCATEHVHVKAHLHLLSHRDPMVRLDAALALGRGGAKAAVAVEELKFAIYDDEKTVSWGAITALGMIGPAARGAESELKRILQEGGKGQRVRARIALQRIEAGESAN